MEADRIDNEVVSGGMFRRVLVGFDGSEQAQRALRVARSLAVDLRGEVHVLLVVRPPAHSETSEGREDAIEAERRNLSQGLADEVSREGRDSTPVSHFVVDGNPAEAIARYAKEHGFDLVVVGTHGRAHGMHPGVGHSLELLLRHHSCPVLVV